MSLMSLTVPIFPPLAMTTFGTLGTFQNLDRVWHQLDYFSAITSKMVAARGSSQHPLNCCLPSTTAVQQGR